MFGRNEFYSADMLAAPTQDLRKQRDADQEETAEVMDEGEEEEEEEAAEEGTKQQKKKKALPRKLAAK